MTTLRSRKGITLIELMVTIAIMGFLVTVALPNIFGVAEKTREKVDLLKLYYLRDALNRALIEDLDAFQNFSQTTNDKSRADIINTLDQGLKDQKRGATLFVIELHNGLSINVQGEHGSANNAYNICRVPLKITPKPLFTNKLTFTIFNLVTKRGFLYGPAQLFRPERQT